MSSFRFRIALFCSKLTYRLLKLFRRNASHAPGWVALRLCPDYLARIAKCPLCVCVTGTNGKTTVTNMLSDALIDNGYSVSTNRIGSNIVPGIASALTNSVSWLGKPVKDACVLEVDERASRLILPYVKPNYLVVTNIFRDSLKRNAHPDYIFEVINTFVPEETKLILNRDDVCSSRLAAEKGNEKVFFGIEEMEGDLTESINLVADYSYCLNCHAKLNYHHLRYHHIGDAYCPQCGFASHAADYLIKKVNKDDDRILVEHDGASYPYALINNAVFNVYNELAVIVALCEIGLTHEQIAASLAKLSVVSSRLNETKIGNIRLIRILSKGQNSVSCSRVFDFLRQEEGRKAVVFVVDDWYERQDSVEFIGWIYDGDFEFLNDEQTIQFLVCGPRCYDLQVRLLLAGVPKERILCCEKEMDAHKYIMTEGIDKIFLLYDTSTLNLAMKVESKFKETLQEAQK